MNRHIASLILLIGLPLAACSPSASPREAAAAEKPAPVLEGAWERAEVVNELGRDLGRHTADLQPGMVVFSKTHYALTAVNGFEPRPFIGEEPTEAEAGRAFAPYAGNTGTYTNAGGKLVLKPIVAKNPANMDGVKTFEYDLSWVGDDLWLTTTTPEDGMVKTRYARIVEDETRITPEARRLAGVWRRAEMVVGAGPDAGTHVTDMQPGYYIFTPASFGANYVSSFAPRPPLSANPTDEERDKVFTPFASFAGNFTVKNDVLTFTPLVTKNPNNMRGRPFQPIKLEWSGNDVWFIYTGVDGTQNRTRLSPVTD